jgi:hypothetical protein
MQFIKLAVADGERGQRWTRKKVRREKKLLETRHATAAGQTTAESDTQVEAGLDGDDDRRADTQTANAPDAGTPRAPEPDLGELAGYLASVGNVDAMIATWTDLTERVFGRTGHVVRVHIEVDPDDRSDDTLSKDTERAAHIAVAKQDLEATLKKTIVSRSFRRERAIAGHYGVRACAGSVEVLGYDGRIGTTHPLPGATVTGGDTTRMIPANAFREWLAHASDEIELVPREHDAVEARSGSSAATFLGLAASTFPFRDAQLAKASQTASMPADRLRFALDSARAFSDPKLFLRDPDFAVCEVRSGILHSTAKAALLRVTVPELAGATWRVLVDDLAAISRWLRAIGRKTIQVLEHPKVNFLRAADGSIIAIGRPSVAFVDIDMAAADGHEDDAWWTVHADQVAHVLGSAKNRKALVRLRLDQTDRIDFSHQTGSEAGPETFVQARVSDEPGGVSPPSPVRSLVLRQHHLAKLAKLRSGEAVRLGINVVDGAAFVRCRWQQQTDRYELILLPEDADIR